MRVRGRRNAAAPLEQQSLSLLARTVVLKVCPHDSHTVRHRKVQSGAAAAFCICSASAVELLRTVIEEAMAKRVHAVELRLKAIAAGKRDRARLLGIPAMIDAEHATRAVGRELPQRLPDEAVHLLSVAQPMKMHCCHRGAHLHHTQCTALGTEHRYLLLVSLSAGQCVSPV